VCMAVAVLEGAVSTDVVVADERSAVSHLRFLPVELMQGESCRRVGWLDSIPCSRNRERERAGVTQRVSSTTTL
jgi:hypothetical protein